MSGSNRAKTSVTATPGTLPGAPTAAAAALPLTTGITAPAGAHPYVTRITHTSQIAP